MKAIKILLAMVMAASLGFAAGYVAVSNRLLEKHRANLARQQGKWQAEKEALEAALKRLQNQTASAPRSPAPARVLTVTNSVSPAETLEGLRGLILSTTGRGVEVAYRARVLQELEPNQYRDLALSAARELLAHPEVASSASGLDKLDREALFGVLSFFNDGTYVTQAQTQFVQANGQIDRAALRTRTVSPTPGS